MYRLANYLRLPQVQRLLFSTLSAALILPCSASAQIAPSQTTAAPTHPVTQSPDNLRLNTPAQTDYTTSWWSTSPGNSTRLYQQTGVLVGGGLAAAGFLYLMPKSVTNWEKDASFNDLPKKWWDNVRRRPVWDKDDWAINYIGHTYFGGVYYQMARKSGYNQWDSFVYTAFMSTFLWEYGFEAFAERPSIQDLIVTPVGGWLYGELAYNLEQRIEENDKTVLGSPVLGGISLFILDPIDHVSRGINAIAGREWILTGRVTMNSSLYHNNPEYHGSTSDIRPGLRLALKRSF